MRLSGRCDFFPSGELQKVSASRRASRHQRAGRLAPGASLFGTAQPRKLCVQDGDGLGGGFPGRPGEWGGGGGGGRGGGREGGERRGQAGAPGPLVAGVGSAAARSQSACLL